MSPLFLVVFIVAATLQFAQLLLGEHQYSALKYLLSGFLIILYVIAFCDIAFDFYQRRQLEPAGPLPTQMENARLILVIAVLVAASLDVKFYSTGFHHFTICPCTLAAVISVTIVVELLGR